MTPALSCRYFLVRCKPCERVFSITSLPIKLAAMEGIIKRARCPRCDTGADDLSIASEADAAAWAQQQTGAFS